MVSVVLACYNGELYIEEQLETIWYQSVKPDEIIISDDASTDSTVQVIESFVKKTGAPLQLIVNKYRKGYADNFRTTLQLASGDFVFLSDQDDLWLPQRIEYVLMLFEKYDKIAAISSNYSLIDKHGKYIMRISGPNIPRIRKVTWKSFLRHPKYPGMTMAYRNEFLKRVKLKFGENIPHDWEINQEAALQGTLYYITKRLVKYRQHDSNSIGIITQKSYGKKKIARIKLVTTLIESLKTIRVDKKNSNYVAQMISFQNKRLGYLEKNQIWRNFLYEVFHMPYITIKSIIGDLYSSLEFK